MKIYRVKEIFKTLQGEGYWTGRTAIFVRFAGCNLWSGHEKDRAKAACRFCDTDFRDGTEMSTADIYSAVVTLWGSDYPNRFVVFTGGEPLLQLEHPLVEAMRRRGFDVAVESNGTRQMRFNDVDWLTISPKAGVPVVQPFADEIKFVFPQPGLDPSKFADGAYSHFFIQPLDDEHREENTKKAVQYCLEHPRWILSLQTHKILNLP
jgi:7-carboxy-7-deazaguanine synthase (Cx14CxxC type)